MFKTTRRDVVFDVVKRELSSFVERFQKRLQ